MFENQLNRSVDLSKFATINATGAASHVSTKYTFIPTTRALAVLQDHGWRPVEAKEARTRKEELVGYQKHSIRLVNERLNTQLAVGSTVPQIMLTNSHGGSSAFELSLALLEKVCTNGLLVSRGESSQFKVRHIGYADELMEEALLSLLPEVEPTLKRTDDFKQLKMSDGERLAYATAAMELRWDSGAFAVNPQTLLIPKRSAEREPNLWNTFNVVQEKIIRGGVNQRDVRAGSKTFGRSRKSRAVTSLDENIKLNRALWVLSEEMAKLRA